MTSERDAVRRQGEWLSSPWFRAIVAVALAPVFFNNRTFGLFAPQLYVLVAGYGVALVVFNLLCVATGALLRIESSLERERSM